MVSSRPTGELGDRGDADGWMDEEADVLPVGSATSSAGREVEIAARGERDKGAIGACQGVGASRARGCRLAIRREAGEGIVAGPRRLALPCFLFFRLW